MDIMKCPKCGLESPATAETCDCGYQFKTGTMAAGKPEGSKQAKPNLWAWRIGCPTAAILIFLFVIMRYESPKDAPSKPPDSELSATVGFSGTQFVITNGDSFDWRNVEMKVNYGAFDNGYRLRSALMQAGQTYTVGALQFAKDDGTRLNPVQVKPMKYVIRADTPQGNLAHYGRWQ
jgi:hypothetical protein